MLVGYQNKINAIKAIKDLRGMGLKEAFDFVESIPVTLARGASKEEAESIRYLFASQGASVTVSPHQESGETIAADKGVLIL